MWPHRQNKSSSSQKVNFLNLCEQVVHSIEEFLTGNTKSRKLLNKRQCLDLSSKLSKTMRNIQELVSVCGGASDVLFKPALQNLYRYLGKAKGLVLECGKEDWCRASVFQSQNENSFGEILLDVGLCYNAIYEQSESASQDWNAHLEDLRQSSTFLPATSNDIQIDQNELRERLEGVANIHNSSKRRDTLKQCLARYLLVKLSCTFKGSLANALDTCSELLWSKQVEPKGTWGYSRFLGAGSGGSGVCGTQWLGVPCAKKEFHQQDHENLFLKEAGVLANLNHPCIINFICCGNGQEKGDRFIAMELMEKNLFELITDIKDGYFSTPIVLDIIVQIARGMLYLHDQGVAHRDLKPQNVVVNRLTSKHLMDYYHVKLVDFGMAKTKVQVSKSNTISFRGVGTTMYRAPEVHPMAHSDGNMKVKVNWFKADVYSFAITCAHVLSLKTPFEDMEFLSELYKELMNGKRPKLPKDFPQELIVLIKDCWDINPRMRPTFLEICTRLETFRHKIFKGLSIHDQCLEDERKVSNSSFKFIKTKLEEQYPIRRWFFDNTDEVVEDESVHFLYENHNLSIMKVEKATMSNGLIQMQTKMINSNEDTKNILEKEKNSCEVSHEINKNATASILVCICGNALKFLSESLYNPSRYFCNICRKEGNGRMYHCQTCQFDSHQECAKIKDNVKVFFHNCPLHLLDKNYYSNFAHQYCDFCWGTVQESEWVYRCGPCNFDVHALCTKYPKDFILDLHPHPLTLVRSSPKETLPFCKCCNQHIVKGYRYTCTQKSCAFDLHPFCANLPKHPYCTFDKLHRLSLIQNSSSFLCNICGIQGYSWFYRCNHCIANIHLHCKDQAITIMN